MINTTEPGRHSWLLSERHTFDEKFKRLTLGFCIGAAISVSLLPSPRLGAFARAYLTLYFIVGEYFVVFGSIVATVAWLVREIRETAAVSEHHKVKQVVAELWWRVLFSPVLTGLILLVAVLFMYLPLVLGFIVQAALYGDYQGEIVYGSESLFYPFNWLHFILRR